MDRSKIKQFAKKRIEGQILTLFALLLLVEFISAVLGAIPVVGGIAALLITGALTLSLTNIFYRLVAKNKKPVIEDLLYGFRDENFLKSLVAYLRLAIFTFLWSLLFVIPGIIKSLAYSQTFFILAEHPDLEPAEAQKRSIAMMDGHKWEYFVLQLSFIPWHLLAICTFGLLYIYVTPYIYATQAAYYDKLSSEYAKSLRSQKLEKVKKAVEKKAEAVKEKVKKATKK